jgi:hypothetical protein
MARTPFASNSAWRLGRPTHLLRPIPSQIHSADEICRLDASRMHPVRSGSRIDPPSRHSMVRRKATPPGESRMANRLIKVVATIVFVAGTSSLATVASATPVANGFAIKNAVPASVEIVQWRRGWGGGGWGVSPRMGLGRRRCRICCRRGDRQRSRLALLRLRPLLLSRALRSTSWPGRLRRAKSRLCRSRCPRCRRCSCVLHAAVQILRPQKRDISRLRWRAPSLSLSSSYQQ